MPEDYPGDEQPFCCTAEVETLSGNDVAAWNFPKNVF